jgi:hypothetical protein
MGRVTETHNTCEVDVGKVEPIDPAAADAADPDHTGAALAAVHDADDGTVRTPTTSASERAFVAAPDGMVRPATPRRRGTFPVFVTVTGPTSVSPGYRDVVSRESVERLRPADPAEMTTLLSEVEAVARRVA